MNITDVKNLFPTKVHFIIFIGYMTLFINQGILVTASRGKEKKYPYNTTTVVLFTEVLKLIVATCIQLRESSVGEFLADISKHFKVLVMYMVPALLYCLYNNLAFVNLSSYDPTTYFMLLQLRVVVTGIIYQVLFSKNLSGKQWLSLLLLTVGCIIKQLNAESFSSTGSFKLRIDFSLVLILVQVFCSCFAGVYNEYLLKGNSGDAPFMLQNVFMYIDSILCNFLFLGFSGDLSTALTAESMNSIFKVKVVAIIINNAGIGIVTALFLKSLNSILKTFASALELLFTAILCWIIFGIAIEIFTVISLVIVMYAIVLYAQNPVQNQPPPQTTHQHSNGADPAQQKSGHV